MFHDHFDLGFPIFTHLKRLQYKDTLEEREAKRHDPLDGLFFAVLEAIQQCEESGYSTDRQQQEPGHKHKPPGQPEACRPFLPHPCHGSRAGQWKVKESKVMGKIGQSVRCIKARFYCTQRSSCLCWPEY